MKARKYILLLITTLCLTMYIGMFDALASNINITFEPDVESVNTGEFVTVKVKMEADEEIAEVEAVIAYNSKTLTYETGSEFINGGDGYLRLTDKETSGGKTREYELQFKASAVGDCSFDISGEPSILDKDFNDMTIAFTSASIVVNGASSASDDATIKELKINPGKLEEKFDTSVTSYKVTVPYDSDFVAVSAITNDPEATISIEGNEGLKVGWNKVNVIATAPAGNTKKYELSVYRQYEDETEADKKKEQGITEAELKKNGELIVEVKDDRTLISNAFEYELVNLEDESTIPAGFKKTKIALSGTSVTAFIPESDSSSEFILLYAANTATGDTSFYMYDKKENTIQRYTGNIITSVSQAVSTDDKAEGYQKKLTVCSVIITILAILLAVALIFVVKLILKNADTDDDDEDDDDDDDDDEDE